jgi:hypothetical protein
MGTDKPAAKLHDILGEFSCDDFPSGNMIYCNTKDEGIERLIDIRGWGFFQYYANGAELQDSFRDWVTKALNEQRKQDQILQISYNEKYKNRPGFRLVRCCGTCKKNHSKGFGRRDVEHQCSLDLLVTWDNCFCDEYEEDI